MGTCSVEINNSVPQLLLIPIWILQKFCNLILGILVEKRDIPLAVNISRNQLVKYGKLIADSDELGIIRFVLVLGLNLANCVWNFLCQADSPPFPCNSAPGR